MATTRYSQPILGLVAFGVAFLSQWLGHSAYTLIHGFFGDYHYYASFLTGVTIPVALPACLFDQPARSQLHFTVSLWISHDARMLFANALGQFGTD